MDAAIWDQTESIVELVKLGAHVDWQVERWVAAAAAAAPLPLSPRSRLLPLLPCLPR